MTAPSQRRAPLARRTLALCALLLGSAMSCVGDGVGTGPEAALGRGGISFAPVFPQTLSGTDAARVVDFNRVRVVLRREDGSVALDTLVAFPAGAESISLTLDVPVSPSAPSTGEPMSLLLNYVNAAGEIVFTGGPTQVVAVLPQPGQPTPPAVSIPVRYTGPGANATRVIVTPRTRSVLEGDPFAFTAAATDAAGTPIAGTPIVWSTLDPTRATLASPDAGSGTALAARGTARIVAQLLTGPADTVTVAVALKARAIAFVSGSPQTGPAGAQLGQPVVVRVTASDGLPVANAPVGFAVASGGGAVGAASVNTDADGLAQTTWRLGPTVGAQTLNATAAGLTGSPVPFSATATAAAPAKLVVTRQPVSAVAGATLAPVSFAVQDAQDNTVTTFTGPVTVTLGTNPAGPAATLGGALTVNAVAGVATFSDLTLNRTGTGYTLSAASGALAPTATAAFDVTPGPATRLEFSSYPTAANAGFAIPVAVTARDAAGNVATGFTGDVTVALASGPAGATLTGGGTTAASAGVATFGLTLSQEGAYTLAASAAGLAGATGASFQVGGGTPTTLALASGGGQSGPTHAALPQPVVVQLQDQFGNAVAAAGRTVTFTPAAGSGSASPATTTTNASGQAMTTWTLGATAGTQTLDVASAGLNPNPLAVTATGVVTSGPAVVLVFSTQPSGVTAGSAIAPAVVVQARDSADQLATSFNGTVTLAIATNPGSGTLSGTLSVAAVGGVATFANLSIDKVGAGYVIAPSASGVLGLASNPFNVTAAPPARVTIVQQPSNGTAGTALATQPVVQVRDAFGNVTAASVGNVVVALAVNPGGATLSGTTSLAPVGGVATFTNLGLDKAAAGYRLTVYASGSPLVADTSTTFTVSPAAPSQLIFTGQPHSTVAGATLTPAVQVTAVDAFGNVATSFVSDVTVEIGANPGDATLSGTTTVTAAAGVATFADLSLSNVGSGYTLTASGGGLDATSAAFDVGATQIQWTNPAGGLWSTASNWSLGRAPNAGDSVLIVLPGTYTVTLDTSFEAAFVVLGGGSGVQTLSMSSRTLDVSGALLVNGSGSLSAGSSTIGGAGAVMNLGTAILSATTVSAALVNGGQLTVQGSTSLTGAVVNLAGATLTAQGGPAGGAAVLSIPEGLTNSGDLVLTDVGGSYGAQITGGTIVNAPGSTIQSLAGATGSRTLNATVQNYGTLTVAGPQGLAMSGSGAAHVNAGTVSLTGGDLAVSLTGGGTLSTTGALSIPAGRTLSVTGGIVTVGAGSSVTGTGTFSLSSLTWNQTPNIINALTGIVLTGVTMNGPGTLTNAAGQTMTITTSSINGTLINLGTLIAQGTTVINTITAAAGSTLRVQGASSGGMGNVTISNGFQNDGTIELTDVGGSYGGQLTVDGSGTITNVGAIHSLAGAGGSRTLIARVANQGSLTVSGAQGLLLNRASAAHTSSGTIDVAGGPLTVLQTGTTPSFTNTGSITIAAGQTLSMSGGTFTQGATAGLAGPGTLSLGGLTWSLGGPVSTANLGVTLSGVTVNGAGTVTNSAGQSMTVVGSTFNAPMINDGTLIVQGNSSFGGGFAAATGSTLRVNGASTGGGANVIVTTALDNFGTIELTDVGGSYGATLNVGGTLTNKPGATITSLQGAGGARALNPTPLINQGTLTVAGTQGLALSQAPAQHVNSGTVNVTGGDLAVTQTGGAPSLRNDGTILIGTARTLALSGGTFDLGGTGVVSGPGTLSLANAIWNLTPGFTNTTTGLVLSSTIVNGPGTLTNAAGQTLTATSVTFNGPLVNSGTLIAQGTTTIGNAFTAPTGSTLRVQGAPTGGGAALSVAAGFTNQGAIELTDVGGSYGATLTVADTLTNDGTITILAGAAGARTLGAMLVNHGTLTVAGAQGLTVSRLEADHANSGTIALTGGDLVYDQTGSTPSVANNGAITMGAGRTLTVNGGALLYGAGGSFSGGALALNGVTWTMGLSFGTGGTALALSSTTVNGSGTLTNPLGQTLTAVNSTINAAFGNNGIFVGQGNTTIAGATFTPGGSSTLRAQGAPTGGGANLTVTGNLANPGTIELTDVGGSYGATLTVTGTLTNNGTINVLPGAAGTRTIAAALNNQGIVNVSASTGLLVQSAGSGGNGGTINVTAGDLTIAENWANSGATAISAGRTVTQSGGTYTHNLGASYSGAGSLVFNAATLTLNNQLLTTVATTISGSLVNGSATLVNPIGKTLTAISSTFRAPVSTVGTLIAQGTDSIGSLTTDTSSVVRVLGAPSGGAARLTVGTLLANKGDIELTDTGGSYGAELIVPAGLDSYPGSTITTLVGATGSRTITGDVNTQGGSTLTVAPGAAGKLTLTGNLILGGTLVMDVGGTGQGTSYDWLAVSGSMYLSNTFFTGNLFGGYTPAVSSTYDIVTCGGTCTNGFEIFNFPGFNYNVTVGPPGRVRLTYAGG